MPLYELFGLIAGLIIIVAYALYLRQITANHSNPNPATWFIWATLGVLNAATYFFVTQGNLYQSFIVFIAMTMTIVIFFYSLFKGRFSPLSHLDIVVLICVILIGMYWQYTSDDRLSNILLQFMYLITAFPTIAGILSKRAHEHAGAWGTAFFAYIFSTLSVYFNPASDWVAYVHPILNGLTIDACVVAAIWYVRAKKPIP